MKKDINLYYKLLKKEERENLKYVYYTGKAENYGNSIVASNGRVLLLEPIDLGEQPFFIDPHLRILDENTPKISVEGCPTFPEFARILEEGELLAPSFYDAVNSAKVYTLIEKSRSGAKKVINLCGYYFNKDYIDLLFSFFEGEETKIFMGNPTTRCFVLKAKNKVAAIAHLLFNESYYKEEPINYSFGAGKKKATDIYIVTANGSPLLSFKSEKEAQEYAKMLKYTKISKIILF